MAPELTLVALPKPFEREFEAIQWNAIQSWVRLYPRPTLVLVGDEPGTAEIAAEVGALHVRHVERSRFGTPLVSDIFRRAEDVGQTPWVAYVNADIVLLNDFSASLEQIRRRRDRFLMVGRRWDLEVLRRLTFAPGWDRELREEALARGRPHAVTGIDYFVYPHQLWGEIPDFALGRFAWDNWLLWRALDLHVPVVDASAAVLAIHQDHSVGDVDGGDNERRDQERLSNIALAGGVAAYYTLDDSSHVLTETGRLMPAWSIRHLRRRRTRLTRELERRAPRMVGSARTCLRGVRRRLNRP